MLQKSVKKSQSVILTIWYVLKWLFPLIFSLSISISLSVYLCAKVRKLAYHWLLTVLSYLTITLTSLEPWAFAGHQSYTYKLQTVFPVRLIHSHWSCQAFCINTDPLTETQESSIHMQNMYVLTKWLDECGWKKRRTQHILEQHKRKLKPACLEWYYSAVRCRISMRIRTRGGKTPLSTDVRQEERVLLCLLAWRQSVNL